MSSGADLLNWWVWYAGLALLVICAFARMWKLFFLVLAAFILARLWLLRANGTGLMPW